MDLFSQLSAASSTKKPNARRVDWEGIKAKVLGAVTHRPQTRKAVIDASGVSPDQVDKVMRELVASKNVEIVYPSNHGRRGAYVLPIGKTRNG